MLSNTSLLINSCNDYIDVLCSQLRLLSYYNYLTDFSGKIYVVTESTECINDIGIDVDIKFLCFNSKNWGERLIGALNEIESEYIFMLFDDYFPVGEYNEQLIKEAAGLLDEKNIDCAILSPVLKIKDTQKHINSNFIEVPRNALYRINSAPAVWKIKSLLLTLKEDDSPWLWECFSMYRKNARGVKVISVHNDSLLQYNYSYKTGGAVYRGSWVESALNVYSNEIRLLINDEQRPSIKKIGSQPRSAAWKIKFLFDGVRSSGLIAIHFFISSLMKKLEND